LEAVYHHSRQGFRFVVDADIQQFFDTLDHQLLMAALRRRISDGELLRLIYRWLKAGYLLDGAYHDTDQGSPQGGVLSPLLANVYLHGFDAAQRQQQSFIGRLTRYADDFVIQCGSAEQAVRALEWAREQLACLGLGLHPTKTRVVNDRETGFDFLGFHHRRVRLDGSHKESRGVLRWPSAKACRRFREQVRQQVGPPGRTRREWGAICRRLGAYLGGWKQYYRHGQSARVFAELDEFIGERAARNLTRSQPKSRGRKKRRWTEYREWLRDQGGLPTLATVPQAISRPYRGQAKVRWRAV
jgi:RNA-directed DNA polymerase